MKLPLHKFTFIVFLVIFFIIKGNTVYPQCPTLINTSPSGGAWVVASSVTISWNTVASASSYKLYFGTASSPATVVYTGTTRNYTVTSLECNTIYYYRITAIRFGTEGSNCTEYSFNTNTSLTSGTIGSPQSICTGLSSLPINELTPATNGSGYIYQWQSGSDNATFTNISGATSTSYNPGTIASSTYYRRLVKSGSGCSLPTPSILITVNTPPVIAQIPPGIVSRYLFSGNANDNSGNSNNGTLQNSPAAVADRFGISNNAYSFDGINDYVSTPNPLSYPSNISLGVWFKTTTTTGGKLIGFGTSQTGSSTKYDRHIYMANSGQLFFGVYNGTESTINTSASFNDGNWHYVLASLSSVSGMSLYVDGDLLASDASVTTAENTTGYFRIGYDNLTGWPSPPTSHYFKGTLDDVVIYTRALTTMEGTDLYVNPDGAGSNSPICIGGTLNLTAASSPGATYAWTGPGAFTSSSQNPVISNVTAARAGTYILTASLNGCASTAAYALVGINGSLSANTLSSNQSVCTGASVSLTGSTPTGGSGMYNYQWQVSPDNNTFSDIASATSKDYAPGIMSATSYFRRYISSGSCTNTSSPVTVTVNTYPSLSEFPASGLATRYIFSGNANDMSGNGNAGTLQNTPTLTSDRFGIAGSAYSYNGSNEYVSTSTTFSNTSMNNISVGIWFNTTTNTGGRLIGFGNLQTGQSGNTTTDRHMYISNSGQIYFGVYNGSYKTITTTSTYRDGNWHFAVATLSSTNGMKLYMDGVLISSDNSVLAGANYTGYLRIGYDRVNTSWTGYPGSYFFSGKLDDAFLYNREISSTEVATLYTKPDGGGPFLSVCTGTPINLEATTLSNATYSWSGPNSFTSTTQNPTIITAAATHQGTYAVTATVNGCTSDPAYGYVTVTSTSGANVSGAGRWIGTSSNFNSSSNWGCATSSPSSTSDLTIGPGTPFQPIVSTAASSRNLTILSGATLTLSGATALSIYGNWTNSGSFTPNNGMVSFIGSSAQSISGITNFEDFSVNNPAGVTIGSGSSNLQTVNGVVTLTNGILKTNANLVLDFDNSAAIAGTGAGQVQDNITVKRTLTPGWRYIGASLNSLTYADINDDVAISTANFYTYRESSNSTNLQIGWTSRGEGLATLLTGQKDLGAASAMIGYAVKNPSTTTLDFTGSYTHASSYSSGNLSYTSSGLSEADGWHLVSNPYPSYINWDTTGGWTKTFIDSDITFYNSLIGINAQYKPANGSASAIGLNGATKYIPPMQAYWIHTNANNAVLGVTNAVRVAKPALVSGTPSFYRLAASTQEQLIKIKVSNGVCSDEAVIRFLGDGATESFDPLIDAYKFRNDDHCPSVFSMVNREELSINSLASFYGDVMLPLGFQLSTGEHTFELETVSNLDGYKLSLLDMANGTEHDLSTPALIKSDKAEELSRFYLHISSATVTSVSDKESLAVMITQEENHLTVQSNSSIHETSAELYTTHGVKLKSFHTEGDALTCNTSNITHGIYLVKVTFENQSVTTKKILIKKN